MYNRNFFVFTLTLACLLNTAVSASNAPNDGVISYYKQTAVVDKNEKRSAGDNTGQFIRFTSFGCYDSDRKGYDIGNGFLKYQQLDNGIHVYHGRSFWGENTNYYFARDFSRLNVKTTSGTVYVYERTTAPASAVTSAKIYKAPTATSTPVYTGGGAGYTPVTPTSTYTPATPAVGAGTGTSTPKRDPYAVCYANCGTCGGTGVCNVCNGRKHHVVMAGTTWKERNPCWRCNDTGRCQLCQNGKVKKSCP